VPHIPGASMAPMTSTTWKLIGRVSPGATATQCTSGRSTLSGRRREAISLASSALRVSTRTGSCWNISRRGPEMRNIPLTSWRTSKASYTQSSGSGPQWCSYCNAKCKSPEGLQIHKWAKRGDDKHPETPDFLAAMVVDSGPYQCMHCGACFGDQEDLDLHLYWYKGSEDHPSSGSNKPKATLADYLPDFSGTPGGSTPPAPAPIITRWSATSTASSSGGTGVEAKPEKPVRPPPPPLPAGLIELPPKEPKETAQSLAKSSKIPKKTAAAPAAVPGLGDFPSLIEAKSMPQRRKSQGPAKKVTLTAQVEERAIPARGEEAQEPEVEKEEEKLLITPSPSEEPEKAEEEVVVKEEEAEPVATATAEVKEEPAEEAQEEEISAPGIGCGVSEGEVEAPSPSGSEEFQRLRGAEDQPVPAILFMQPPATPPPSGPPEADPTGSAIPSMQPPAAPPPSGPPEVNPFDLMLSDEEFRVEEEKRKAAEREKQRAAYQQSQAAKTTDIRGGEVRTLGEPSQLTAEQKAERLLKFVENERLEREAAREKRLKQQNEEFDRLQQERKGGKKGKPTGAIPTPTQQRAFDDLEEQRLAQQTAEDKEAVSKGQMTEVEAKARDLERQNKFLTEKLRRSERAQLAAPLWGQGKGKGKAKEPEKRGRGSSPKGGRHSSVPPPASYGAARTSSRAPSAYGRRQDYTGSYTGEYRGERRPYEPTPQEREEERRVKALAEERRRKEEDTPVAQELREHFAREQALGKAGDVPKASSPRLSRVGMPAPPAPSSGPAEGRRKLRFHRFPKPRFRPQLWRPQSGKGRGKKQRLPPFLVLPPKQRYRVPLLSLRPRLQQQNLPSTGNPCRQCVRSRSREQRV
jgi:hypothetical protein